MLAKERASEVYSIEAYYISKVSSWGLGRVIGWGLGLG